MPNDKVREVTTKDWKYTKVSSVLLPKAAEKEATWKANYSSNLWRPTYYKTTKPPKITLH